jgi:hypothetical protein
MLEECGQQELAIELEQPTTPSRACSSARNGCTATKPAEGSRSDPNTESPCELVGTLAVPAASAKSNAVEIAAVSKFFHGALGELDLFHGDLPEGLSSLP